MRQLQLLDQTPPEGRARKTDPQTSKDAAASVQTNSLCFGIVNQLWIHEGGLTIEQIAANLERKEVSVSPRMTELVEKGFIKNSGRVRVNGSGHKAIVWERM